eukprot:scaffold21463_cov24-Tisochrysis_lutea.AAC.1
MAEKLLDIVWQLTMPADAPPELLEADAMAAVLKQYQEQRSLLLVHALQQVSLAARNKGMFKLVPPFTFAACCWTNQFAAWTPKVPGDVLVPLYRAAACEAGRFHGPACAGQPAEAV